MRFLAEARAIIASIATLGVLATPQSSAQAPQSPARQSFVAEVLPARSLTSDGSGSYRDREGFVTAFGMYALALCTDTRAGTCSTYPVARAPKPFEDARALVLDLSAPVIASGAKNLGVIRSAPANFGAFWGQDTTQRAVINGREGWIIRSVLDMDVGRTIESERVEIRFFRNGVQHILQFGPWTAGQYQPSQGAFTGDGTTPGRITRVSETQWLVTSGAESLGRLWDNHDPSHPTDLGLYRFSYDVQFERK